MAADLPGLVQQIAHFESRLQADPTSRAYLPLADLYRRAGNLQRARQLLVDGLARDGGFLSARVALGEVLLNLGEASAGRLELQAALARDPDNVLALQLLVRDAANLRDWVSARQFAERLLRLLPESAEVRGILRQARGRTPATMAASPRAAAPAVAPATQTPLPSAAAPEPTAALTIGAGFETPTLADLYRRQGHAEKARAIIERILAAEPERPDALEVLARLDADSPRSVARSGSAEAPALRANGTPTADPARAAADAPARPNGQNTGRSEDLDRFRAWLDRAGEPPARGS
jgi:tetratricopeptide (TPR) repeat protein